MLESWEELGNLTLGSRCINYQLRDIGMVNPKLQILKYKVGTMQVIFIFISKDGYEDRKVLIIISKCFANCELFFKSC